MHTNAAESMQNAAADVKLKHTVTDPTVIPYATCRVSLDGSWQKRGHAPLHGVVTAISEGKCVDTQVLTKYCRMCRIWEPKKGTPKYDEWYDTHKQKCQLNHEQSSGAMESAGAVDIFSRPIEQNELIYPEYLGDGDSSSFKDVVTSKPYEKYCIEPSKNECVGHVQKRLGTSLRNKVKAYKGTKTPLGGKGTLTKKTIDSMQNWYGMAIRHNLENLYQMKKAVGAILWHCTDFSEGRHRFCPLGINSWCKFQKDKVTGKTTHKNKINLSEDIFKIIKPIFHDLASDELLSKCLHGQTQNPNESINKIIWTKCPKTTFVHKTVIEMGVNSAILQFNDGISSIHNAFQYFGFEVGSVTNSVSLRGDRRSINKSLRMSSEEGKLRRKKLRSKDKSLKDKEIETELIDSYSKGAY